MAYLNTFGHIKNVQIPGTGCQGIIISFLQEKNPTKNDVFSPKKAKWGKIRPPGNFFHFFLDFSPVNSPDRCGGMPGDYFQVIAPFYRTKIREEN